MSGLKNKYNIKDEYYTPAILVEPILQYIPDDAIVWCPFDTEKSEFVKAFQKKGNKVIFSHLRTGQDFFDYEPEEYDYIVSNPPFSTKLEVFERLYKLGKPFAMLMNMEILNYQIVGNFFYNHDSDLQLLIVDKKVSYDGKTAMFNTSFFCKDILPKDLVFTHLEHNNTGDNFIGSEMYKEMAC